MLELTGNWLQLTGYEGVALIFLWAVAVGHVVDHVALGVRAAHAHTWVAALVAEAGLVPCALGVDDTLGLALDVRIAEVVVAARADAVAAVGIGTARVRRARVARPGLLGDRERPALHERVAGVGARAAADRLVVDNLAVGADAADSLARVAAALAQTRLVREAL